MKNFVGVFPASHMNQFIDFKSMIFEKAGKYPFLIANTDSSDKDGTYWWSILDTEPKTDLVFFIRLELMGLNTLLNKSINQLYKKYYLELKKWQEQAAK